MRHTIVAAAGQFQSPSFLNGAHVTSLILFAASILGAIVGVAMLGKSHKGRFKDNFEKFGNVVLAFAVIAASLGGIFYAFGGKALGFFFGSGS